MQRFVSKQAEHRLTAGLSSVQQILRKELYLKEWYERYNNLIFDAYLWVLGAEEIEYELQIARMSFLLPIFCVTKRGHQKKRYVRKI